MLVLSRKLGEEILLPDLGVSIKLVDVRGQRIRLGISAPPSVVVLRSEIADSASPPHDDRQVLKQESLHVASKGALSRPAFAVAK